MQIIEAEQFGAQAEVTMQRRQMCFGLLDQRVIDGRRYRVTIQRLCQRLRIMADFGIRAAVLEHLVERGPESILVRLPFAEELIEHLLAFVVIGVADILSVLGLIERSDEGGVGDGGVSTVRYRG